MKEEWRHEIFEQAQKPLLPIDSVGQPSFASRQAFSSSGVSGCLKTAVQPIALISLKLFGAVSLHKSQ
jgi:hypothetical protein